MGLIWTMIGFVLIFLFIYGMKLNYDDKEKQKRIDHNNKLMEESDKRGIKVSARIQKLVSIPRCSKCDNDSFELEGFNSSSRGLEIKCVSCGKKRWIKIGKESVAEVRSLKPIFYNSEIDENGDPIGHKWIHSLCKLTSNTVTRRNHNRHSIPKNVKQEVWQRDNGKCVECGSKEKLEYDHIIPVSKGGANTTRNIQLLCENCNRTKSTKIM